LWSCGHCSTGNWRGIADVVMTVDDVEKPFCFVIATIATAKGAKGMSSPRRKRKPQSGEEDNSPRASQVKKKKAPNSTQVTQTTAAKPSTNFPLSIQNNPEFLTAALRLPEKYADLEKMFDTLDTACSLFHSRKQTLTLVRLQSSMELALGSNSYYLR
jgi:hypothetical protein